MPEFFGFMATHPELLTFFLVGIGSIVGVLKARGVALGSAAVLFVAIGMSAWAKALGVTLSIPGLVANLGLSLFCFSVGIASGASFFHTLRKSALSILGSLLAIIAAAVVAMGLAGVFGLTLDQAAGTYAGAVTNTPALAAAGGSPEATVGYSVAYIFGVVGMIFVINIALRHRKEDADAPSPLMSADVRVERTDEPLAGEIEEQFGNQINITRIRHEENGPTSIPAPDEALHHNDVVTVDGPQQVVEMVVKALGHRSSHQLVLDRRFLDYRRVTVSDPSVAGRTIDDLDLEEKFSATIARVRRGDVDMVAVPSMILQLGDRVRVVAPQKRIPEVSKFLGDSSRGLTNINPAALGIGLALGFALGSIAIPSPSGGTVSLGGALGSLIVGLIMGFIGRIGKVITTMPFSATSVLSDFGLLLFLAQAGIKGGTEVAKAFTSGAWIGIVGLGVCATLTLGLVTYFFQRKVMKMGGTRLSGVLAGTQNHPALLAYANGRTDYDFRVSEGYSMIYPIAMTSKIIVGTVLGLFV